jgi:thiamine-monophosphate kinase
VIQSHQLPLSEALRNSLCEDPVTLALSSGDDYELCFTVSEDRLNALLDDTRYSELAKTAPLTVIGRIVSGQGVVVQTMQGDTWSVTSSGYHHF